MITLTPGARRLLEWLATTEAAANAGESDENSPGEVVCEGLECWYGLRRTNGATVKQLRSYCLISDSGCGAGTKISHGNESGRRHLQGLPPDCDGAGRWFETWEELIYANSGKKAGDNCRLMQEIV